MTTLPTIEQVYNRVIELGKEDPDFVYTAQPESKDYAGCYYHGATYDGRGRPCIVGQALADLGVPREVLVRESENGTSAWSVVSKNDIVADPLDAGDERSMSLDDLRYNLRNALTTIQNRQDDGKSWGEAISNYS